jgi:hypothetical protein
LHALPPLELVRLSRGNVVVNVGIIKFSGTNGIVVFTGTLLMLTVTVLHVLAVQPEGAYETDTLDAGIVGIRRVTLCAIPGAFRSHTVATRAPRRIASLAVFQ